MAIRVKTKGEESHVVTEEGLKAFGIDPRETDPDELRVAELVKFQGWLQAMNVDFGEAINPDFDTAARLYLGLDK